MDLNNTNVRLVETSPIPLNIEFSCNNGEIFVIAGPSGSGKTTILRSIAGLYKPTSGKITCQGKNWFDSDMNLNVPVQNRAVGFVFQNYALFPHLSVRNNIAIALQEFDKELHNQRLNELINLVHLNGLDNRLPHQLSGGQQQRVAVARCLAREPDILLLDEPFSSVDQQTRRYLVRELVQLRDRLNIPIIHVTHDLNEARRIADKLCIINDGISLQIDTPEKVMANPSSAQVAKLTGHDNVFTAKLNKHDKNIKVSYINWHNHILESKYFPNLSENDVIDWFIPSSQIILHETNNASINNKNILPGKIVEFIQLGEGSILSIELEGIPELVHMNFTTHRARNDGLVPGKVVSISLLPDGIHLMKNQNNQS